MATVTKNRLTAARQFAAPYGNVWADAFNYTTNASGHAVDSNTAAAVAVNDVVRIGLIEAGTILQGAEVIVSDAFTASTTADIGFAYVDGVDDTAVPQDAAYFFAVVNTAATGRTNSNVAKAPVRLAKDAWVVLTRKGANDASVGILDLVVRGIKDGAA